MGIWEGSGVFGGRNFAKFIGFPPCVKVQLKNGEIDHR